jgi:glyoxylase-like metal-dependent hydrolase (beta-lactamase superfamily II)
MKFRYAPLLIALLLTAACARPPAPVEQQFIDDVAAALGGKAAIEAADALTIEAEGRRLNIGQDLTPESTTMEFGISGYTRSIDLANDRSRTVETRTPLFDYFRGRDPFQVISGIDGDVAYDIGADGSPRRASQEVAMERRSDLYHHPLTLVRAVLAGNATVGNVRNEGGLSVADIATDDEMTLTMAVDPETHLPAFISSNDFHPYFRDVVRWTGLSGYESVGALMLPSVFSRSLDEFHVYRLEATAQSTDAPTGDIGAPTEAVAATPASGPAPANVEVEVLADGVWYLNGQSHHSVLLEFSDHLMFIEAPNEARTLAVIDKARELVPGKPIRYLVNTHHHFDHSGGVRTAVAEGLTVITHAANEAFYRRMAAQPSTIVPDALSRSPKPIETETVNESRTYEDEAMSLTLYHVAGSQHSASILMAYLPEQRLLIEADLYTPGRTAPQTFAPNMLENIERYGLEVDRVVPIHGGVVDFETVEAAVSSLQN